MVGREDINYCLERAFFKHSLSSFVEKSIVQVIKCGYSYKQMRAILSKYSQEEKYELLSDLMNDGEKNIYESTLKGRKYWLDLFNECRKRDTGEWVHTGEYNAYGDEKVVWEQKTEFIPLESIDDLTEKEIQEHSSIFGENWVADWNDVEKTILKYERRILEGYELNKNIDKVPKINLEDYAEETSDFELERLQLSLQSDKVLNMTDAEIGELAFFFHEGSIFINGKIYNSIFWRTGRGKMPELTDGLTRNEIDKHLTKHTNRLDSAIEKSEGLAQPTKLYSGMYFDSSLNPGDTYTVKGYISASYDKNVAQSFRNKQGLELNGYTVTYLTPTGKKVICANDMSYDHKHTLTSMNEEHEALMGRNTECQVVSVDYNNREAIVKVLS